MSLIVSPLRYPGGKSRAIRKIVEQLPTEFSEFREPFVGGGSVFCHLRQKFPRVKMWINDLNVDLFCFWQETKRDSSKLAAAIQNVKDETQEGRLLFEALRSRVGTDMSDFDRAVRFFVLNRISFSGTVDSGGYSEGAYRGRFTDSSIRRVKELGALLNDVRITNEDYTGLVQTPGNNVFIFLDPPYLVATKSRLYGVNGELHIAFDHERFAQEMKKCKHSWLITYDDSPDIRENFEFAFQDEWELQYGMNNYKRGSAAKGKELFIANYNARPRRALQPALLDARLSYRSGRGRGTSGR